MAEIPNHVNNVVHSQQYDAARQEGLQVAHGCLQLRKTWSFMHV